MMMLKMAAQDAKVCVFCDELAVVAAIGDKYYPVCPTCDDFKGLMTIEQWENYTGERWEW